MTALGDARVRCARCGADESVLIAATLCPHCGGLLEVEQAPTVRGAALRALLDGRLGGEGTSPTGAAHSGVWRFAELVFPAGRAEAVSHPEGNTPLLAREAVAGYAGVRRLMLKHEGHNPTGSFKDRGMTVAVTQAVRLGARAVACASTGNTSASLSAYAAQAGIPAFVFVPAGGVSPGKIAQTLAYGARVVQLDGDFDACLRVVYEAAERFGIHLVNSVNPFRIEGQKTIVLEMLQQLGWEPPDWIALPAGNLGNTAAFGKALREARSFGLIDRVPRLLAVQAAGAAPFARGYAESFVARHRVHAETRATAIRIGDPASWDRAVRVIRETRGVVQAVSDDEIFAAKRVIDRSGIGCEPASAASVAGVRALRAAGTIGAEESVVAVLTGHVLKDSGPADADAMTPPASRDQALEYLERVLA